MSLVRAAYDGDYQRRTSRAPGEAAADRLHQQQIARRMRPSRRRDRQGEGNRGGRGVAVVLHGDHHALHRHAAACWAVIVMMRRFAWCGTSQSTSAHGEPGLVERGVRRSRRAWPRRAEDFLARHPHDARRCRSRRAAVDVEEVAVAAVGMQVGRRGCRGRRRCPRLRRPRGPRAGAVAEQDAGAAVGPVEDAREGLGADHQHASRLARGGSARRPGPARRRSRRRPPACRRRSRRVMPSRACTMVAAEGKVWSGGGGRDDERVDVGRRSGRRRRAPRGRRGRRGRRWSRLRRRSGGARCRCGCGSIRRRCRAIASNSAFSTTRSGR